jgi:uncharacterized protein
VVIARQYVVADFADTAAAAVERSTMAYFLLEYSLVDDYLERRSQFREEHLGLARRAHQAGDLVLAGALADPADRAILIWSTDAASTVEAFAAADPYVRKGLVTSWTVRP